MSQRHELLDAQSMLSDSAEDDTDYSVQIAQERLKRKKIRRALCICTAVLVLILVAAGAIAGFVAGTTSNHDSKAKPGSNINPFPTSTASISVATTSPSRTSTDSIATTSTSASKSIAKLHSSSTTSRPTPSPTPSYTTANSKVLDYIDTSYDPCENFYEYSCGQWSSTRPDAAEWGTFHELALDNYNKLAGYLSGYERSYDPTAIKKAKRIYSACTDTDYISDHLTDQIESFMVSAGGWEEVDYTPAHSWSINSNLYKDHYLGSSAFFSFGITPDDLNSSKPVIRVCMSSVINLCVCM